MTASQVTQQREYGSDEINILPLLIELLKKLWLIMLAAVIMAAAFYGGTKLLVTPTYRASFTAYINNRSQLNNGLDTLTNSDLTAAQQLVRAYSETIHSRNVLSASAATINLDKSFDELKSMVSTEVQNETEIITVYVEDITPEGAYKLAKAIADTSPQQISEIIEGSSMRIIDMPQLPTKIYKPHYIRNALIGFFIGALLASAFIIVRFILNDKVKNESELEARFTLPVVGVIPDMNATVKSGHSYNDYDYSYRYGDSRRGNR